MKHAGHRGLEMAQSINIEYSFGALKNDYGIPSKIIELGTAWGGFAAWLRDFFCCEVYTFDNVEWGDINLKKLRKSVFEELNINYQIIDVIHEKDRFKISSLFDNRTLLLCDAGQKNTEFDIYGKLMPKGSIIMAHDYAPDRAYFTKNIEGKIWNHLEFEGDKFKNYCKQYNLYPYLQNEFEKSVWFSRMKY